MVLVARGIGHDGGRQPTVVYGDEKSRMKHQKIGELFLPFKSQNSGPLLAWLWLAMAMAVMVQSMDPIPTVSNGHRC